MDSQGAQFGERLEANLRQIVTKDLFLFLLDHEVKRARRYQNFISILFMKLVPFSHENNGKHFQACQQMLSAVLMEEMRETDILGSLGENKWVALLPYADVSAGDQARIRFENTLKYYDFKNRGFQVKVQQFCFPRNGTNTPDLIKKALETAAIRES